jgi:hypothetical protein
MPWKLLPLKRTESVRVSLRRYAFQTSTCPNPGGTGYHSVGIDKNDYPPEDVRWPKTCACGYEFQDSDQWDIMEEHLMEAADGSVFSDQDAPVGACWQAWWLDETNCPNNRKQPLWPLILRCPPGKRHHDWHVDGGSSNGGGWTRSGPIEMLTVTPSIAMGWENGRNEYHGWVGVNGTPPGYLSEDIEGRTFPNIPRRP